MVEKEKLLVLSWKRFQKLLATSAGFEKPMWTVVKKIHEKNCLPGGLKVLSHGEFLMFYGFFKLTPCNMQ